MLLQRMCRAAALRSVSRLPDAYFHLAQGVFVSEICPPIHQPLQSQSSPALPMGSDQSSRLHTTGSGPSLHGNELAQDATWPILSTSRGDTAYPGRLQGNLAWRSSHIRTGRTQVGISSAGSMREASTSSGKNQPGEAVEGVPKDAPRQKSVPFIAGHTIVLHQHLTSRGVRLVVNDDPSQLMFVSWPESEAIRVLQQEDNLFLSLEPGTQIDTPLVLNIPPRYCSAVIYSNGGNVHVGGIKEGSLLVGSNGGAIHVNSMAGTSVMFSSEGGDISGSITAGTIIMETYSDTSASGSVRLDKLLSNDATINTRDPETPEPADATSLHAKPSDARAGEVHVTALYCDEVDICTGGADVNINTMSTKASRVLTFGGDISIGCLDGSADLRSGGGAVQCALQKNVVTVDIYTGPLLSEEAVSAVPEGSLIESAMKGVFGDIQCSVDPDVQAIASMQCAQLTYNKDLHFKLLQKTESEAVARLGPSGDAAISGSPYSATAEDLSTGDIPSASTGESPTAGSEVDDAAHPAEHAQRGPDAAPTAAAATADPALRKRITLIAGKQGSVNLLASSWKDGVQRNFQS
mmetsp:Transcript_19510/g.58969  ORF Transcript_19510/g.58969 Transcript_19510/m.58969 type:complete len:578 (+) Transcript_19510:301-2034(+)